MRRFGYSGFSDFLIAALCILFAIAFQIQITLFASPTYLGLRISMADLLVPFAGLGIFYTLLKHRSSWPLWPVRYFYGWLGALTVLLAAALLNTHFTFGEISRWALVNKFGGWFILVSLLGCGAWIGTNAREKHLILLFKTALYFMAAVTAFDVFIMVAQTYPFMQPLTGVNIHANYPIDGLMANRNIYGLFYVTVVCLATCLHLSPGQTLKPWYATLLYFFMPFFLVFNGSRAMFLSLCVILPCLFIFYRAEKKKRGSLLLSFVLGATLLTLIFHDKAHYIYATSGRQLDFVQYVDSTLDGSAAVPASETLTYPGDTMRLTILADAKELIAKHPVFGSGLGSMFIYQQEKHSKIINLIDCTPLWLLVETGIAGLLIFLGFYVQCARALFMRWKHDEGLSKIFRTALLGILIGFTIMSLFHELMYTRFIWFLLGLGLTLPSKMRQDV